MSENGILEGIGSKNHKPGRVPGGTCWADAIRNFNVETDKYIQIWVDKIRRKMNIEVRCFLSDGFFLLITNGKILTIETYGFVEEKRCESYESFGEWLTLIFRNDVREY